MDPQLVRALTGRARPRCALTGRTPARSPGSQPGDAPETPRGVAVISPPPAPAAAARPPGARSATHWPPAAPRLPSGDRDPGPHATPAVDAAAPRRKIGRASCRER